jgi:hypothetical protein
MSGWMKYPYQKCLDCPECESDHDDDIVNHPFETCAKINGCEGEDKEES